LEDDTEIPGSTARIPAGWRAVGARFSAAGQSTETSCSAFTIGDPGHLGVPIAGGIGITRMMNMRLTFTDLGDRRSVILLNGDKHWETITFRDEPVSLETQLGLTLVHLQ